MAEPADLRPPVLAGAYDCIARYGMAKVTLDDVAKASGVSRATIYRLFPPRRHHLLPLLAAEAAAGRLRPGVDVDHAADFLARVGLSLIGSPGRWDLEDPDEVRTLVRTELLGGILRPDLWPPEPTVE